MTQKDGRSSWEELPAARRALTRLRRLDEQVEIVLLDRGPYVSLQTAVCRITWAT